MSLLTDKEQLELASIFSSPLVAADKTDGSYLKFNWLIKFDGMLMEWLANEESQSSALACPPDSGKSMYVSGWFPAWYMITHPDSYVLGITHSKDMAKNFGDLVRANLNSMFRFLGVKELRSDINSTNFKLNDFNGSRYQSMGRGARVLSHHPHLLILDDLIGESAETESATTVNRIENKVKSDYLSRVGMVGRMLLSMQRLSDNDPYGFVAGLPGATYWNFPALPFEDKPDIIGREPNEPLAPMRYDYEYLVNRRKVVGESEWWTSYMGMPTSTRNKPFSRDKFMEFTGEEEEIDINEQVLYGTMDCAYSDDPQSDFTVLQIWGYDEEKDYLYLWDQFREQMIAPTAQVVIENYFDKYPDLTKIYIEGLPVYDQAKSYGYRVEKLQTGNRRGEKWLRAQVAGTMVNERKIYINKNLPGLTDFYLELGYFYDKRVKDDQVDCLSHAARVRHKAKRGFYIPKAFREDPEEDKKKIITPEPKKLILN